MKYVLTKVGYATSKDTTVETDRPLWIHTTNKIITIQPLSNYIHITLEKEPKIDSTSDKEFTHIR